MNRHKQIAKLVLTIIGCLMVLTVAAAQNVATYRDAAAWDQPNVGTYWVTTGYDILMSQTNVTAAQLGTSNGIPNIAGILGKTRIVGATNTLAAFNAFLATNPVQLPYTLWTRTVTTPIGMTNIVVSDWTNIVVSWTSLPPPPANLRVQLFGP